MWSWTLRRRILSRQVAVTGSQTESGTEGTELGMFTIFDLLTLRSWPRSTVLHLPEWGPGWLLRDCWGGDPEDVAGLSVERRSYENEAHMSPWRIPNRVVEEKGRGTTVEVLSFPRTWRYSGWSL